MTAHSEQSTPVTTAGNVSELIARLEGAYSTVFERSLARAAAAALRELSKDAERYRWLREDADTDGSTHRIMFEVPGYEWDAAIDAALGGTEGP